MTMAPEVAQLNMTMAELKRTVDIYMAKVQELETFVDASSLKNFQEGQREILYLLKKLRAIYDFDVDEEELDVDEEGQNVEPEKNVQFEVQSEDTGSEDVSGND